MAYPREWSEAERELWDTVQSAVEANTGSEPLGCKIADAVLDDGLRPTPALLRHLAEWFDGAGNYVLVRKYAPGAIDLGQTLRTAADFLESCEYNGDGTTDGRGESLNELYQRAWEMDRNPSDPRW